jgi:secernin
MCDTIVVAEPGRPVWLAKNSDREPSEAQCVEWHPRTEHGAHTHVACTHVSIPQTRQTHAVVLGRPAWMWGAEMGVNERGLAIGNEAVFTREPVAREGLTGMDLLRLALERCDDAEAALALIVELLERHPQGGSMGHRNKRFRYHSAFVIADPSRAWLLETAGTYWAARRIEGRFSTSNLLTIGTDFDQIHPRAFEHARERGWCRSAADFDFARCYGRPFYRVAAGGELRRACTARGLARLGDTASVEDFVALLTDHADCHPRDGVRMRMTCAHASFWPTRHAGQTTGSMIARLDPSGSRVWATGTSSPCLSIFKPVALDADRPGSLGHADEVMADTLWWRHEALHRLVLQNYTKRRATFEKERIAMQEDALSPDALDRVDELWREHFEAVSRWTDTAAEVEPSTFDLFGRWWGRQAIVMNRERRSTRPTPARPRR